MKCPKCGYLGFEHVERCRNCGYDFSLASALSLPELPIRDAENHEVNSFDDLAFVDLIGGMAPPPRPPDSRPFAPLPPSELPLFGASRFDDVPLIMKPSPPRPPLAVRRATPEVPRVRAGHVRAPMLDIAPEPEREPPEEGSRATMTPAARAQADEPPGTVHVESEPAALLARVVAVAIDLAILTLIDAIVIYFTMQICGLAVGDFNIVPKGPLLAFLFVQNGGYLVAFTVGGQTLGKMAAGIKVVPARSDSPLDLGHSIVRTLVWIALASPAGLGFLTALCSRDRRGLHDRCAGTRVVRATI